MSMWELEALAETAVQLVAQSQLTQRERRNLYESIFTTVNMFDVSFTHFRTAEELCDAQFFFQIDVEDHPEFEGRKDLADLVGSTSSAWVTDEDGTIEAYYNPPSDSKRPSGLWFDVSMTLWQKCCSAGLLEGLAAEPVERLPAIDLLFELMKLASAADDRRLLKMFHGFLPWLVWEEELTSDDPRLQSALELPHLADALQSNEDDWIDERFDARAHLEYAEEPHLSLLKWWCTPYESET